jgi:hypothetical protein
VTRRCASLLSALEQARFLRPSRGRVERRLAEAARHRFTNAPDLLRLHESALFLRAYPHNLGVRRVSEEILAGFAARVERLEKEGVDLSAFDAPEASGVAGTAITTIWTYDVARWLRGRFGRRVTADWEEPTGDDRLGRVLPRWLPLLEEEAAADANVPYLDWLAAARPPGEDDLGWLLARIARTPLAAEARAALFDGLGLFVRWELARSSATRTRMRRRGPRPFFQDEPLMSREEVSLERELSGPRLRVRRLGRRQGERAIDQMRAATAARYREFYTFTFADPRTVLSADVGRGMEILLVGVLPEKRLPLRSAYGGFFVRNGVPVGYIEGIALGARIEMGVNVYYTFRNGESAWIYAQILRMFHQVLGVTSFSIDPYQLGHRNEEAIESGAFWFYRKLGFRPTDPELARLVRREEAKIAARPAYRTPARLLRRLARRNAVWEYPPRERGPWDSFHVRNLGLAVDRRMAREFAGDAEKIRAASWRSVARKLDVYPERWSTSERAAFAKLALVLDLIPGLGRWPAEEKRHATAVCRAKAGREERRYLRLLQEDRLLTRALVRLGSVTRDRRKV